MSRMTCFWCGDHAPATYGAIFDWLVVHNSWRHRAWRKLTRRVIGFGREATHED